MENCKFRDCDHAFCAWTPDGNLAVGEPGQHWDDAGVVLFGGDAAAEYAATHRVVQLNADGFFPSA